MKSFILTLLVLLAIPQNAPVAQNVPTTEEPHHKLLLENTYVRVFRVSVPAHEATLLHRHDLPYLTVSLGNNDLMNAVAGKPEVEATQKDQQINYSKGGFAHAIRPLNDSAFNNITVELLRPQGTTKNLCEHVVDGPVQDCKTDADAPLKGVFATDEIAVDTLALANGATYSASSAEAPQLLIACDHSDFKIDMAGRPATTLHGGEVFWLAAGETAKITSTVAKGTGSLVIVAFKAGGAG
jgi:hypothetical protein